MMKYETLTTVKSARVQFPQKDPLCEGPSNSMSKRDIENVIKRGGHRACFHATMLTNTVINLR